LVEEASVPAFRTQGTRADSATWTASTEAWPADAPEVRAAVKEALGENPPTSLQDRAERVLAWVHAHVRYGGDFVGSRYGTAKVLAQGFGRCWDQSDVFVTLCRAAGVPARQVGGWLHGGEGHVWAEILVGTGENNGEKYGVVLAVDPGTTWLGASEEYVPLWHSGDGRTPFVYWAAPKIDDLACIK
jgi:transglutaminase-like putative cysteine protease